MRIGARTTTTFPSRASPGEDCDNDDHHDVDHNVDVDDVDHHDVGQDQKRDGRLQGQPERPWS